MVVGENLVPKVAHRPWSSPVLQSEDHPTTRADPSCLSQQQIPPPFAAAKEHAASLCEQTSAPALGGCGSNKKWENPGKTTIIQ